MPHLATRLGKMERRLFARMRGVHRYTDEELLDLIAWLKDTHPAEEEWATALLRRERLL